MEINRNMLMMTPREEADHQRTHFQNPQALNGLFVGIYTSKTFLSGGAGTWQIRSKKVDDETEKRLHFHNPPALVRSENSNGSELLRRAVTQNNLKPRHDNRENKSN